MTDHAATSPDDRQPPALPAPGARGDDDRPRGRATGRNYAAARRYSPEERMALIYQAIRDGVSATSDRNDVPRSTLTTWLEEFGGIEAVRQRVMAGSFNDFVRAERSVYDAVVRRADELPADELMLTFRRLVEARLIPTLTGSDTEGRNGQPALAAAKATVELRITEGEDGKVTVVDLGPVPAEEDLPSLPGEEGGGQEAAE